MALRTKLYHLPNGADDNPSLQVVASTVHRINYRERVLLITISRVRQLRKAVSTFGLRELIAFNARRFIYSYRKHEGIPLVTVVVPLFNEERFVIDTLKSIARQSYSKLECIVVNDKSTDSSATIVDDWIKRDARFRLIHHTENKGLAGARNTGLFAAKGKYVTFLDSDDFLFSHSIYYRVRELIKHQRNKEVVGSYCKLFFVPESGISWKTKLFPYIPAPRARIDFLTANGECPFNAHAPLMRTSVLRSAGGFKEEMRYGAEDWELWMRLLRNGYCFMASGDYGGAYRQKQKSMVRTMADKHVAEGMRILAGCHLDKFDRRYVVPGAPYIFWEPIGYYQHAIVRAKRLVLYTTIAYMADDQVSLNTIVQEFQKDTRFFLRRKINLDKIIDAGIARFIGDGGRRTDGEVGKAHLEAKNGIKALISKNIG
jgi:glycosyltransferase involved in cell wall biosynthesis